MLSGNQAAAASLGKGIRVGADPSAIRTIYFYDHERMQEGTHLAPAQSCRRETKRIPLTTSLEAIPGDALLFPAEAHGFKTS